MLRAANLAVLLVALAAGATGLAGASGCDDSAATTFVPADARPPADASPYDGAVGVECKGRLCEATCCRELIMPGQAAHYCLPEGSVCEHIAFTCDGPEDCPDPDQVCCEGADAVSCLDATACFRAICHKDEHCPADQRCCDTPVGVVKSCKFACE